MPTYGHICYVAMLICLQDTIAKSIYNNRIKLREEEELDRSLYPVKRKSVRSEQVPYIGPQEESLEQEYESSDRLSPQRYRHSDHSLYGSRGQPSKFLDRKPLYDSDVDLPLNLKRFNADRVQKRGLYPPAALRRDRSYGIVYDNGRPFGILEPYPTEYELAPLNNFKDGFEEARPRANSQGQMMDILYPVNRMNPHLDEESPIGENEDEESSKFIDDKYPSVLENLKVDSKIKDNVQFKMDERNSKDKPLEKRDAAVRNDILDRDVKTAAVKKRITGITDKNIEDLKASLVKLQNPDPSDNVDEIEDNLRGILGEMGLVDDNSERDVRYMENKRDIVEDEDMENGDNKIEIVKEPLNPLDAERRKREDLDTSKSENCPGKDTKLETGEDNSLKSDLSEDDHLKLYDRDVKFAGNDLNNMAESDKDKVHEENNDNTENKRDVPKLGVVNYQDEEGSSLSRNKRNEATDINDKTDNSEIMKDLEKSGELTVSGNKSPLAASNSDGDTNNDKTSSRGSSSSSDKIKRANDAALEEKLEQDLQKRIDAIKEQVKREIMALKSKSNLKTAERRKREIFNTLIDEEKSAPNPNLKSELLLKSHIRKKRNLTRKKRQVNYSDFENDSPDYSSDIYKRRYYKNDFYDDTSEEEAPSLDELSYKVKNYKSKEAPSFDELSYKVTNYKSNEYNNSVEVVTTTTEEVHNTTTVAVMSDYKTTSKKPSTSMNKTEETTSAAETASGSNCSTTSATNEETVKPDITTEQAQTIPKEVVIVHNVGRNSLERNESFFPPLYVQSPSSSFSRRKRANALMPDSQVAYVPYRSEDDEVDDEGDEFDDDGFDDRTANLRTNDYDDRYREYLNNYYYRPRKKRRSYAYVAAMDSDNFENGMGDNFLYPQAAVRMKRHDYEDMAAVHGNGGRLAHLSRIRGRSPRGGSALRNKRTFVRDQVNSDEQQRITDLSDTDIFGALPQSYEGELSRFKRVKRKADYIKDNG